MGPFPGAPLSFCSLPTANINISMEFRLVYRGPLKGNNARVNDKQQLRREFHRQLKQLWSQGPLKDMSSLLAYPPNQSKVSIIFPKGEFHFAPLISTRLAFYAELEILFLRPQPRGFIITDGGDIDNRLKTLLDGLRMPRNQQEIPNGDKPQEGENPFFCLLEDDSLVTSVSVSTDQLLEPINKEYVLAIIKVEIKRTTVIWANIGF